jgi:hypothetical protein
MKPGFRALLARLHPKARPAAPSWAVEDTQEVEALRRINRETVWATESTGMLSALSAGLQSLDQPRQIEQDERPKSVISGSCWTCRSGELVGVGDVVALCYGASSELVAKITAGTERELRCTVVRGALAAGEPVTVTPDRLLVKVSGR